MNTNPKVTAIAIPGLGGSATFTAITLTIMASKVEVIEDPSINSGIPQGLTGFRTDTQPASGFPEQSNQQVWLPQTAGQIGEAFQPITFGGEDGRVHGGLGGYVGAEGTIVLYLQSYSQLATQVLLVEWA